MKIKIPFWNDKLSKIIKRIILCIKKLMNDCDIIDDIESDEE